MKIAFGLDFGTSNSALGANRNDRVELLDIDVHNPLKKSLKSVLYFIKEGGERRAFVGHEAVQEYIATAGEGRYMQSIKTFLPDSSFEKTDIFYVDDVVMGRPVALAGCFQ